MRKLKEEFGEKIDLTWKSFMLVPEDKPGRQPGDSARGGWLRCKEYEPDADFRPYTNDIYPKSSIYALSAAKCAELQGKDFAEKYHNRLMRAIFAESKDISDRGVLIELASEAGLDIERFKIDYDSGSQRETVMKDYLEAVNQWGITGIPTAIFVEKYSLVGAQPLEVYRHAIDTLLEMRAKGEV
ncbi:MAG: DsbA family protein [Candidatus Tectomicrobia bacterium]|nr:DsbA family protein [Candidatus Tectomicrobia bacterium]